MKYVAIILLNNNEMMITLAKQSKTWVPLFQSLTTIVCNMTATVTTP